MSMKKVLLAGAAASVAFAGPANASIVDNPHFKVLGLVIVWGDGNVVNDFIIDSDDGGSNDADLIAGNVTPVVTGDLVPGAGEGTLMSLSNAASGGAFTDAGTAGVLDADDSFTAFTLNASTDIGANSAYSSTWYAASNTAFNVSAAVGTPTVTGSLSTDDISYDLTVADVGANATTPNGTATSGVTLSSIDSTDVWAGNNLTADAAGSILSQAWSFTSDYTFDYDLSMGVGEIEVDVTYTVYVP